MTLGAIADEGEGVVLEVVLELLEGPVCTLEDLLLFVSEAESLDTAARLLSKKRVRKRNAVSLGTGRMEVGQIDRRGFHIQERGLRKCFAAFGQQGELQSEQQRQ